MMWVCGTPAEVLRSLSDPPPFRGRRSQCEQVMTGAVIFENPPVRLKQCRHGAMMYLANDLIGRSLDLYGEFAEQEMQVFRTFVGPGGVAVDVGANIGTHTLALAEMAGPTGRVYSFEPQRALFNLLCGNLALNRATNVRARHAAVGEAAGAIETPPIDYGAAGAFNFGAVSLADAAGYPPGGETVELITLDSLALDRCDLLKIDVEGMERPVLAGAAETLRRTAPVIYLENNRRENSPALLGWLLTARYRCYWHLISYYAPDNFFGAAENIFPGVVELNVIAIPAARGADVQGLTEIVSPEDWPV